MVVLLRVIYLTTHDGCAVEAYSIGAYVQAALVAKYNRAYFDYSARSNRPTYLKKKVATQK